MDELARNLIKDHKNPLVKIDLPVTKLFLKFSTPEEAEFIGKHQNILKNVLRHERADRRCARSQAEWSSENNLAKVTKVMKSLLQNFGYQEKNGIFLYPEETLFLMETNRLEVTHNKMPLSIQEGYEFLLRHKCSLIKYRVYKKLALLGYRLLKYEEVCRRKSKSCSNIHKQTETTKASQKRMIEEREEIEMVQKKVCSELETELNRSDPSKSTEMSEPHVQVISDIFQKLRRTAPRKLESSVETDIPDYCVFFPNNKTRCDYDFNLCISEESILERKLNDSRPTIYAICSGDNISFYKISTVDLPSW